MQQSNSNKPIHPQYLNLIERHNTFGDYWPKNLPVEPTTLTLDGFFYTGKSDWVVCFQCGIGLKNVTSMDNITDLHLKTSISCQFITKLREPFELEQMRQKAQLANTHCKIFIPKEQDFVLINHLKINSTMREMGNQLRNLKTKYRARLDQALSTINFYKKEIKSLKENVADLLIQKLSLNREIEILLERFECPICIDAPVTMVTSCGHVYCRSCIMQITDCAKCRRRIRSKRNIFI